MLVSIVCPNMSLNGLGRAYWLARVAQRAGYKAEVLGPRFGSGVWPPLAGRVDVSMACVPAVRSYPGFLRCVGRLISLIRGEVVWAVKPLTSSFFLSLLASRLRGRRLILDIDDWEWGFFLEYGPNGFDSGLVNDTIRNPNSMISTWLWERMTGLTNQLTVSNTFLCRRFGGEVLPHGRDETEFQPDPQLSARIRSSLGFSNQHKIVLFLGTPRPSKGVEDLIEAFAQVSRLEMHARLVIIGLGKDEYSQLLRSLCKKRFKRDVYTLLPMCPFSDAPGYISTADVVVIPQRHSPSTVGQMPVKIYDAMALARPIISTCVSDIPLALEACGWVVEPGNPNDIARALVEVLSNPESAQVRGALARQRFLYNYSLSAVSEKVKLLLQQAELD